MVITRCLFLLVLLTLSSATLARDVILWQTYHRPPGIIQHGPDQGKGFVQQVLDLIINRLPEYQHVMPLTTFARALADIKSGKFTCHPAVFKTREREQFMYFSQAVMMSPTSRLISKKGTFTQYVVNNQIQLRDIADNKNFTLALVKGRSYTEVIDQELKLYVNKNNIFPMSNTDLSPIFQLIEMGRVDATIAYEFELQHYADEQKLSLDKYDIHQLVGLPNYSVGHVGCPKNEWGEKVITKINTILTDVKPTDAYIYALTYWWPHKRNDAEFIDFYHNEFLPR